MNKTLIFTTLLTGSMLAAAPVFELSGDAGFHAVVNGKTVAPRQKTEGAAIVPGLFGNAVHLDNRGILTYPLGSALNKKQGTIVFWFKPDQETKSRFVPVMDRDRLPDGSVGPVESGMRNILNLHPFRFRYGENELTTGYRPAPIHKRWFKDQWNLIAFTWDAREKKAHTFCNGVLDNGRYIGKLVYTEPKNSCDTAFFGYPEFSNELGANGTIDEFRIYDRAFSFDELLALYAEKRPFMMEVNDYAWNLNQKNRIRLRFKNITKKKISAADRITITDATGKTVFSREVPLSAEAGGFADAELSFQPENAGLHRIHSELAGRTFETLVIAPERITDRMPAGDLKLKLVGEIDLTRKPGWNTFRADKTGKFVTTPAGTYFETGTHARSGFLVRLPELQKPNRYHVLEVEYPDDAKRTFTVTLYSIGEKAKITVGGQMNGMGILTGGAYPLSGKMRTKRLLWLPDAKEVTLICENYSDRTCKKGGAISKIRIFEVQSDLLPKLPELPGKRKIGVWDEDPTMDGTWFNMPFLLTDKGVDLEFWREKAERTVEYARHQGYNMWTVQLMEYDGDRNGSDLSMYSKVGTTGAHIYGCMDTMAKVFEREKLPFYGRLGINWGGHNGIYFLPESKLCRNEKEFMKRGKEAVEQVDKNGRILFDNHIALNPIHPENIAGLRKLLAFYRDKYADNPMFLGLTLRDTGTILSFQNLKTGYEDFTVALFEKETGIKVPDTGDGTRFHFRYKFLTSPKMKQTWINWRCKKLARTCEELVREVRKGNDRLRLQIWVSCKNSIPLNPEKGTTVDSTLKEAGIDMGLLAKIEGLDFNPVVEPDFIRVDTYAKTGEEDFYFSQPEFNAPFRKPDYRTLVFMLHNNQEHYPSRTPSLPELFYPTVDWLQRKIPLYMCSWANSYPREDFALMPLAAQLAYRDVDEIHVGYWGNPDSSVTDEFRAFNHAFRSIPDGRYTNICKDSDSVAVNVCGKNFYLVNKMFYPVALTFRSAGTLKNLVTGETVANTDGFHSITVPPQGVTVFRNSQEFTPKDLTQNINPEDLKWLKNAVATLKAAAKDAPKLKPLAEKMEKAAAEKNWPEVRAMIYIRRIQEVVENAKPFTLSGKYVPEKHGFLLNVSGQGGEIRIKFSADGAFEFAETERTATLSAGKPLTVILPFSKEIKGNGQTGTVRISVADSSGNYHAAEFLCGGDFAEYAETLPVPGKDWSFKAYSMTERRKESPQGEYRYRRGMLWNEKGLSLAVEVEDADYFPPDSKLKFFRADSLQIFLDPFNTDSTDTMNFSGKELEFSVYEQNGKTVVRNCTVPENAQDPAAKISAAMEHREGVTRYEVRIPAGAIPGFAPEENAVFGFCPMINNRIKGKGGLLEVLPSPDVFPYPKPGVWHDLILRKK